MPPYIYTVIPVKLLHCICAFALVSAAACSSGTSSTGTELSNDDSTGIEPNDLILNNSSSLVTAFRKALYKMSALDGSIERVFAGGEGNWEFLAPVDVVNDVAYISSTDNALNAINLNTGTLLWEYPFGRPDEDGYPTVPSCSASSCYIVDGTYDLHDIGIPDGKPQWSVSLDRSGGAIQAIGNRLPLITEQKIYVGTDYADRSYRLNVYSRNDGRLLDSIEFEDQIFHSPVASDGKLLVVTERSLHALDFSTHETIWRTEFSGLSIPVVIGQTVIALIYDLEDQYVDTNFGTAGMNISTGEVIWAARMPLIDGGVVPASDGSLVITAMHTLSPNQVLGFSSDPTYPRALDPADGSVVWDLGTTGVTKHTPLAVPGHLFYASMSLSSSAFKNGVTALDSSTGEAIWIATDGYAENISQNINAELVLVHDGQVYRKEEFPTTSK